MKKYKKYNIYFSDRELSLIKYSLEFFFRNSEEDLLCQDCSEELSNLLDIITQAVEDNLFFQKMVVCSEKKGGDDNDTTRND